MTHLSVATFWLVLVLIVRSHLSKDLHFFLALVMITPLAQIVVSSFCRSRWYVSGAMCLLAAVGIYPRVGAAFLENLDDAGYASVYRPITGGRVPSLMEGHDRRVQVVTPVAMGGVSAWRCSGSSLEFFGPRCRGSGTFRNGLRSLQWLDRLIKRAKRVLRVEPIAGMPAVQRRWTEALIFGAAATLPAGQKGNFKRLGLYHLLVMSGQHFTIVIVALGWALSFPVRVLYTLHGCSYRIMVASKLTIQVLLIASVWIYFGISDTSPAILRAAIASTVALMNPYLLGVCSGSRRILLVLFAFLVCSPSTLFSLSAAFSFFAYTIVVSRGDLRTWPSALGTQLQLAVPGLMWFGQFSMLGALVALPMMSAFNWVMLATLAAWALAGFGVVAPSWISAVPSWYHWLVDWLVGINDALNAIMREWLSLDGRVVSLVSMFAMGLALLNAIGRSSTRVSHRGSE